MARIITVHGTHAHVSAAESDPPQWWQPGSAFYNDMAKLLEAPGGHVEVSPFVWSGNNSEVERREAGEALLAYLETLEAAKEPYCLVGHSHGGSVISAALIAAAARKRSMPHLKRWITVGTPFVSLQREMFLMTRLGLWSRVAFVASMMLLIMFLVSVAANFGSGQSMSFGARLPGIQWVTAILMSLPAIVFYGVLRYLDGRSLKLYRRRVVERARKMFGPRWLSLTHADDEAVQGLAYLPSAKLDFFARDFAVSSITALSVIALPVIYVAILLSPSAMVGIADVLLKKVYETRSTPAAVETARGLQHSLREAREAMRKLREAKGGSVPPGEMRALWQGYRDRRAAAQAAHPDLAAGERTLRFRQRFFERTDMVCDGKVLCGGGQSLRINSGLLLHLATDELSWAIGAEDQGDWRTQQFLPPLVAAVLVPIISFLIALAVMLIIRAVAIGVSRLASALLNNLTNAEVKRSAFGNDTDGEVAVGASDRPVWLEKSPPRLPAALAARITEVSNGAAVQSVAKFRQAIGRLAFAEPGKPADAALTSYFTWKELVHSTYFDVPQFSKLVAEAVGRCDGFAPSIAFRMDPDRIAAAQWLAEIEGAPATVAKPEDEPPGPEDVKAVSAVIASTVKAEP